MTTQRRNSPARAVVDDVIGLQTKEHDKRTRPVVNCVLLQMCRMARPNVGDGGDGL